MWKIGAVVGTSRLMPILQGLDAGNPNFNHVTLAALARHGILRAIVTTNFDSYIERAFQSIHYSYGVFTSPSDWQRSRSTAPTLSILKVHGSLDAPHSMRFMIDQVQHLDENEPPLKKLLTTAPVLILGYSGFDEDIFPILKAALTQNPFQSCACVYPGSSHDEPIQQWSLNEPHNIFRLEAKATDLLQMIVEACGCPCVAPSQQAEQNSRLDWRSAIDSSLTDLPRYVIAHAMSEICHITGSHRDSMTFADLGCDICDDLADASKNKELDERARRHRIEMLSLKAKALVETKMPDFASGIRDLAFAEVLKGNDPSYLQRTWLAGAHTALRLNDFPQAERLLDLTLGLHLVPGRKEISLEQVPTELMICLWYRGILQRKRGKLEEAEALFEQALSVALSRDDVVNGSRIALDFGFCKCRVDKLPEALQIWEVAKVMAERANDWDTAAKASKNKGVLLSISDNPELAEPEFEKAKHLFERAGNYDGTGRIAAILRLSLDERRRMALGWYAETIRQ